ncbi:hypothetical protein KIN20_001006 [Parelaphostrongylus tenuis]|uniref:Uncharacterized protein n=1 Tax=Parelaphostrongylus tenuis TaxID=148309 RepID=A0AAD5LWB5_PARTN|nr:hypothetical protein KIN20_001006 [Parelaphostrongylus tenuis]
MIYADRFPELGGSTHYPEESGDPRNAVNAAAGVHPVVVATTSSCRCGRLAAVAALRRTIDRVRCGAVASRVSARRQSLARYPLDDTRGATPPTRPPPPSGT